MTINPILVNIENTNSRPSFKRKTAQMPYLEANGAVNTDNNVKPLPPQGHLIHDSLGNSIKYFFKDIGYDMKSVKNGINGTANDHQLGRLNDVGLTTAGILIATYLASKTPNTKARIMEYVGLGAFLTAMSVYPKLFINTPAKIMHGYDIDKQYIDDQGRKKSVMQDANYVPYDMYLGEIPEEDLEIIGDKMGIPRDIKNRNDVTREQMRKIATQNNTLWMLTAGVTPALSALLCYGLENYVVAPAIEKSKNSSFESQMAKMLKQTQAMAQNLEADTIQSNQLSSRIEGILSSYRGQELPKEEFDNLYRLITENMDANISEGIKDDLAKIFKTSLDGSSESIILSKEGINDLIQAAKNSISKNNRSTLEQILVPTAEELEQILTAVAKDSDLEKGSSTAIENISKIKQGLKNIIDSKIAQTEGVPKEFLESKRNDIIENICNTLKTQKSSYVSDDAIKKVSDFAKIIGEFKKNQEILDKCKAFKVEYASDTVIANSYGKFEKTLLNELGISFKDLKKMRESQDYTKEILDKKLLELCKDESRFFKTMEKLGKVVSDMEVGLNGSKESGSHIIDLITAVENNYNSTAKRLAKLNSFESTINRLVKQDVESLGNSITTREQLYKFLDGTTLNPNKAILENGKEWWQMAEEERIKYIQTNAKGVGSSKNLEITRIVERYQGAKNSMNRVMHTLDVYRRALTPENFAEVLEGKSPEYVEKIIKEGKEALLSATSSEHTLKLNLINNPNFYKDLMNSVWAQGSGDFWSTTQKGFVTEITEKALEKNNSIIKGNVLDRFQHYISRFRNVIANSNIDFTKPDHILNSGIRSQYSAADITRMSAFNLVGQSPVDMVKGAAGKRYATQKWVRIVSAISGSIIGIVLLAQLGFGKLSNPQNLQKQVNDEPSK